MINPAMLDGYNDDEIREVIALGNRVLKQRDDTAKTKALETARATAKEILEAAGLTLNDLVKGKLRAAKAPSYRGGHTYQHPANKALVWSAKGKKPNWLVELEADGDRAVELSANEGVSSALRKAV